MLVPRGILNGSGVESAITRPHHGYHPRIEQKAAALVHGIVSNHGFVDGNKRTAVCMVEVLAVRSGYRLAVEDLVLADVVTAVAPGRLGLRRACYVVQGTLGAGRHHRTACLGSADRIDG